MIKINVLNLKLEVWKEIYGFKDYHISNYGRIKSFKKYKEKIFTILKLKKDSYGYLFIGLYKNRKRYNRWIHRLIFETFVKKIDDNYVLHHIDENKENNYLNNLIEVTKFEHDNFHNKNILEKSKKLISDKSKGENNSQSILTEKKLLKYGNI